MSAPLLRQVTEHIDAASDCGTMPHCWDFTCQRGHSIAERLLPPAPFHHSPTEGCKAQADHGIRCVKRPKPRRATYQRSLCFNLAQLPSFDSSDEVDSAH